MSLIQCPECAKEISEYAENCPECGAPINKRIRREGVRYELFFYVLLLFSGVSIFLNGWLSGLAMAVIGGALLFFRILTGFKK